MGQELARFSPGRAASVLHFLGELIHTARYSTKTPAVVVLLTGAALCGVVSGAIKSADGRAKRFAAFIANEVEKDAKSRNIKIITVGAPGTFDLTSKAPIQRRSTGYLVEGHGVRTAYQVESVQVCASPEPSCWKVTRVTYGDPI